MEIGRFIGIGKKIESLRLEIAEIKGILLKVYKEKLEQEEKAKKDDYTHLF